MDEYFAATLDEIHAFYDPSGITHFAAEVRHSGQRAMALEMHEQVHAALCDESEFGWLYRFLAQIRLHPDPAVRRRASELMGDMMPLSVTTHEGLACLQELTWIARHEGLHAAFQYAVRLPDTYGTALILALDCFEVSGKSTVYDYSDEAIHGAIVCIGDAILDNQICARCADPVATFESDDNSAFEADPPDDRFSQLARDLQTTRYAIYQILDEAQRHGKGLIHADAWIDLHRYAFEQLRVLAPNVIVTSHSERQERIEYLCEQWVPYLNDRAGSTLFHIGKAPEGNVAEPGQGIFENWQKSELNKGYIVIDGDVVIGTPSIQFTTWQEFVDFQAGLGAQQNIFWILSLATNPSALPLELLAHCEVLVGAYPMWFGSVSATSPLAHFYPAASTSGATMEQLIRDSDRITEGGGVWYSDIGRIQAIRSVYPTWRALAFEKCTSPRQWLDRVATMRRLDGSDIVVGLFEFERDNVLIAFCGAQSTLTFTRATPLAASFIRQDEIFRHVLEEPDHLVAIGPHAVPLEALARAALWGLSFR